MDKSVITVPPVVLIVEDDEFIQMVFQRGFSKNKITTYSALNGLKALDILNEIEDITHVILDLNMPVMDGYSLLSCLNKEEKFKGLNVSVTSCNAITVFTEYVKMRNIDTDMVKNYFIKPVAFNELFQAICTLTL